MPPLPASGSVTVNQVITVNQDCILGQQNYTENNLLQLNAEMHAQVDQQVQVNQAVCEYQINNVIDQANSFVANVNNSFEMASRDATANVNNANDMATDAMQATFRAQQEANALRAQIAEQNERFELLEIQRQEE